MASKRQRHAARFFRMLVEKELRLNFQAQRVFRKQGSVVATALRKGSQLDALEVAKSFESRWVKLFVAHYTVTAKDFGKIAREQIGQEIQRELPSFDDILLDFIARESLRKASLVNQTTLEGIKKILSQGVIEGWGTEQTARTIRKEIAEVQSVYRSRIIARTETHNAATFAGQATAESSGLELEKEWVTAIDGRERSEHKDADGQTVALKQKFSVFGEEIERPGEGTAKNTINCRCSLIYHPRK